jgi:hypothetical protein
LTLKDGQFLVRLARKAVEKYLENGKVIPAPPDTSSKFMDHYGVFITLNSVRDNEKKLRGCIGFPYPTLPLVRAVIDSAINSATQDPRFPPVSYDELDSIVFEVSVLTPPQLIKVEKPTEYPSKIEVGKDGLIVERGYYKGLLLPQVPIEWNWNEEEFICQCCMKAGLSPDCWVLEGTKIYKFSCIIAQEVSPNGDVVVKDLRR